MTEGKAGSPLPDFELPPVIEVVVGVQYDPLLIPTVAFGQFWIERREQYPSASDQPLIASTAELVGSQLDGAGSNNLFSAPPLPRVLLEDSSGNWVLQLQHDRLLYNWRKIREGDEYPRFEAVYTRFSKDWNAWTEFLGREHNSQLAVKQLELTYVNHVPLGSGWESVADIGRVFPAASWQTNGVFLPAPEILAWRAQFRFPNENGVLHVALQQGVRRTDRQPVLLCELTARGLPKDGDLEEWFRMAREWIVRGFTDLTSATAHENLWKRRA